MKGILAEYLFEIVIIAYCPVSYFFMLIEHDVLVLLFFIGMNDEKICSYHTAKLIN